MRRFLQKERERGNKHMVNFIKTTIKKLIKNYIIIAVILAIIFNDDIMSSLQVSFYITIIYTFGSILAGDTKKNKQRKRKRPSILGAFIGSAIRSSNRRSDAFQRGMSDAIYNSFSSNDAREEAYRQQRRQADQRARDRWDAIDRQKKAEWDAKDAALRGKDRAAYNYKNQADYWRNQSKKY